ncbi:hypothetical protein [Xanthobacter sediminis]
MSSIVPIRIAGTGHASPGTGVRSEDLDRRLGLKPGHLERVYGVKRRPVCDGET